jgi:hypothetical protein
MFVRHLALVVTATWALATSAARADDIATFARDACVGVQNDPQKLQHAIDDGNRAVTAKQTKLAAAPADKQAKAQLDSATHAVEGVKNICGPGKLDLWRSLAGKDYPTGYLEFKSPGFCGGLELLDTSATELLQIQTVCDSVQNKSTGFEGVAISLVQGLGDLLVADAKSELLDYFLSGVAKDFCNFSAGEFSVKAWFGETCKYLLADHDTDNFSFDDLKSSLEKDLKALPKAVSGYLLPKIKARWPNADKYAAVAGAIILVSVDVAEKKKVGAILDDLDDHAEEAAGTLTCDFTTATMPDKACTALLVLRVARTAADDLGTDASTRLTVILQDAFDKFCSQHGSGSLQAGGACVVSSDNYRALHDSLLAAYQAASALIGIQKTIRSQTDALPGELAKRTGPETAEGIRNLVHAMRDTLFAVYAAHPSPGNDADKTKIDQDVKLVDLFLDAFEAAVQSDPAALRKAVLAILRAPEIAGSVSASTIKTITVVVSLATAKDRAEAKSILSDAASPVGSYKMKYGTKKWIITVNGYVGFSIAEDYRQNTQSGVTGSHASKLAMHAPVGLDFTVPWCTDWFNFGFGAQLIDPLALDVSTTNDTVSADWKTVVAPGAYIKFGLLKTPLALGAAVDYSFAERDVPMSCPGGRCFDGAWQVGVFLSADVPLFILH